MAIEFSCPACHAFIRTADGTAGRQAQCPQCRGIVLVPDSEPPITANLCDEQIQADAPSNFLDADAAKKPPGGSEPRTAAVNPYATPANPFAADPFQSLTSEELAAKARWKLIWPAAGMIAFALLGLGFMAIVGMAFASDPQALFRNVADDPAARAGANGFLIFYFTVGFVSRVLQLLGAIAMIRQRGYALALAGGISALVPCEIYCCIPAVPLGIWALILLNTAEIKAAFGRN